MSVNELRPVLGAQPVTVVAGPPNGAAELESELSPNRRPQLLSQPVPRQRLRLPSVFTVIAQDLSQILKGRRIREGSWSLLVEHGSNPEVID